MHLEELANALQETMYRFKPIYKVMYVASSYNTMNNFIKDIELVATDLEDISSNKDFDGYTRSKAKGLYHVITGQNFRKNLYVLTDIISIITETSLKLQRRQSTQWEIKEIIKEMMNKLKNLKTQPGDFIKNLYKDNWDDKWLDSSRVKPSEEWLNDLIDSIVEETRSFFNDEITSEILDFLEPKYFEGISVNYQLQFNIRNFEDFDITQMISKIVDWLGIDPTYKLQIARDYVVLFFKIKSDEDFITKRSGNLQNFWAFYLKKFSADYQRN